MTTHYEKRLEQDLAAIRERIQRLRRAIDEQIKNAVHSLLTGDRELANTTILGDHPINRETRALDTACHAFVARHLPSAGNLRYVSSVLRLSVALERIGDYAASICREALQLASPPEGAIARDIDLMSDQSRKVLQQAVHSFLEGNAELARGTTGMAAQTRDLYGKVFDDLLASQATEERSLSELFALQVVLYRLERISALSKNVCEETIFAVTGQTKEPKVYRVLFVDSKASVFAPMAVALARRAFPESGRYSFAGYEPERAVAPTTEAFLDERGLDVEDLASARVDLTEDEINGFHVIVGLEGSIYGRLEEVPFKTTVVEWPVGRDLKGLDRQRQDAVLAEVQKDLASRIGELMEILRGEDAA